MNNYKFDKSVRQGSISARAEEVYTISLVEYYAARAKHTHTHTHARARACAHK